MVDISETMLTAPIRIGVLGCANIAKRSVIPAILSLSDDFKLVAVASRQRDRANSFASQFNCEAIYGYDQLIDRHDIDAIYVPLPTGLHFEWVKKAINHGKHVYVEKSFAMSEREVSELLELSEKRRAAVFEGFMFLHHRQLTTITSMLRDGVIGEMRYVYSCFGFPPLASDDFRYDPKVGGGALMDAAGYPTRLIRHLLGASAQIRSATLVKLARGASTRGSAFYTANGEVSATSVFGFDQQYQCCVDILGSKGRIRTDRIFTARPDHRVKIVLEVGSDLQVIEDPEDDHFVNAMRAFLQLIRMPESRAQERENIRQQSLDLASIERFSTH